MSQSFASGGQSIRVSASASILPMNILAWFLLGWTGWISLQLLEWVAYPFSSGSSQPRNQTRVSCIAGWFFTNWAIREAHRFSYSLKGKERKKWWQPHIFNDGILYADQHCFCEFLSQILGPILRSSDFTSLNRAQEFVPSQAPGR